MLVDQSKNCTVFSIQLEVCCMEMQYTGWQIHTYSTVVGKYSTVGSPKDVNNIMYIVVLNVSHCLLAALFILFNALSRYDFSTHVI